MQLTISGARTEGGISKYVMVGSAMVFSELDVVSNSQTGRMNSALG